MQWCLNLKLICWSLRWFISNRSSSRLWLISRRRTGGHLISRSMSTELMYGLRHDGLIWILERNEMVHPRKWHAPCVGRDVIQRIIEFGSNVNALLHHQAKNKRDASKVVSVLTREQLHTFFITRNSKRSPHFQTGNRIEASKIKLSFKKRIIKRRMLLRKTLPTLNEQFKEPRLHGNRGMLPCGGKLLWSQTYEIKASENRSFCAVTIGISFGRCPLCHLFMVWSLLLFPQHRNNCLLRRTNFRNDWSERSPKTWPKHILAV